MLDDNERCLLEKIRPLELMATIQAITKFDRRSGSDGENNAIGFLASQLDRSNIPWNITKSQAWLSQPGKASLTINEGEDRLHITVKTWSFCGSTQGKPLRASLRFVPDEDMPANTIDWLVKRGERRDLTGHIAIGRRADPVSILSLQDRGAVGYVLCWNKGDELQIHEGNINMIWGTPLPDDLDRFLSIPVVVLNRLDGLNLLERLSRRPLVAEIRTTVEGKSSQIPVLEAVIEPETGNDEFLLIGNHLDSWHLGATDNGTGNALALRLAETLYRRRKELTYGARICWWSGHSNGRYAGSSIYARDHFDLLNDACLAYMNVDMPGLRGACDYSSIGAGPDMSDIAVAATLDVTGQLGSAVGPVRGWDQSFQNLGISSYFVWASTLPEGHRDRTGDSFMSWWWHTEEDIQAYCDPAVLEMDARLYLLAAYRFLNRPFSNSLLPLFRSVMDRLDMLDKRLPRELRLSECIDMLQELQDRYRRIDLKLCTKRRLQAIRKLNQIAFAQKGPALQDWAVPQEIIPGLSMADHAATSTPVSILAIQNFEMTQRNRITGLIRDLKSILPDP